MMQKGKSLKDLFEENYTAVEVPAQNKKGYKIEYLYSGPWYIWDMPKDKLKREKWMELGLSLTGIFLYLFTGAANTPVNTSKLGVILAVLALCIHVLEIFALIKFICAGYRTTKMTYQKVDRILGAATGLRGILLCGVAFVAFVYAVTGGMDMLSLLVTAGYLGCGSIAFMIYRRYNKITFYTEKNRSLEGMQIIDKTVKGKDKTN